MATGEPTFTISSGDSANTGVSDSLGAPVTVTNVPWYEQTHWVPSTYYYYWPTFQPDKTRQAFQIVKMLQDKGLVELKSVKRFVALVDEIYKLL